MTDAEITEQIIAMRGPMPATPGCPPIPRHWKESIPICTAHLAEEGYLERVRSMHACACRAVVCEVQDLIGLANGHSLPFATYSVTKVTWYWLAFTDWQEALLPLPRDAAVGRVFQAGRVMRRLEGERVFWHTLHFLLLCCSSSNDVHPAVALQEILYPICSGHGLRGQHTRVSRQRPRNLQAMLNMLHVLHVLQDHQAASVDMCQTVLHFSDHC